MAKIKTTDLVNAIFTFCEVYSGRTFYKYQAQFAKRLIRSVLTNDGAEITALFSRQSGKTETVAVVVGGLMIILPQLANMPMFADDIRLTMFKDGFWCGIFAPSLRQSQITYGRMKGRLQCREAVAILEDPDFRLEFSTSNGQTVALSNGSFCTAISASDSSNIEGESFKFIICEECQDISNFKIQKSIHPMGAAYNATICKIGTATTFKGDFYESIQRNKREYESGKTKIRNHFEYDYRVVQKYNPKYENYIKREKRSLGESSDAFRMSYCLEWVISRGMFVDISEFEKKCGSDYLDRVERDKIAKHVVGIDVGGGSTRNKDADSTVITVLEVDWDNPVMFESSYNEETNEEEIYMAYNTILKDWLEISPEIAEDYEEQYQIIMDYLRNFNIMKLVIDGTRESSLGQRIRANETYEVEIFVFSIASKSEIYKNLDSEINTKRFSYPNSIEARETKEHRKFIQQFADLEKGYSGSRMIVSHPAERGAHDDYTDSLALAMWGAREPSIKDETETKDRTSIFKNKNSTVGFYRDNSIRKNTKNTLTARRR